MARLFNGTSHALQSASALAALSGVSRIAIGFWIKTTFAADDDILLELSANSNTNNGSFKIIANESVTNKFWIDIPHALGKPSASVPTPSNSTWHHVLFNLNYANSYPTEIESIYVDGAAQTITDQTVGGANNTGTFGSYVLNVMSRNNASLFADGDMADLCIWAPSSVLTSTDATALQTSRANAVRTSEIAYYWPLAGTTSPEPALIGSTALTVTGATASTDPPTLPMVPVLDASSPAAVFNDTAGITSLTTASFTPPSGSIVIAKVISADGSQTHTGVTGLTFTNQINVGTAGGTTRNSIWTAVGAGSAVTVTAAFGVTNTHRMLLVEVWTNAQLAATPATHNSPLGGGTTGAPTDTLTTTRANSVVSWLCGDWAQITGARTYRSSAVETGYHTSSGQYTGSVAYQAAPTVGSQTYGMTLPTGQTYLLTSIEIQAKDPVGGAILMETGDKILQEDNTSAILEESAPEQITASDTVAISTAEATDVQISSSVTPITGSDTADISVTESVVTTVSNPRTETAAISTAESVTILVTNPRTETGAISTTETSSVVVPISASDSIAISATEATSIVVPIAASDTAAISTTEATSVVASVSATDTAAISVSESRSLVATVTASESISISASEVAAISATVTGTDTVAISATESTTTLAAVTASNSVAISAVESGIDVIVGTPQSSTISWNGGTWAVRNGTGDPGPMNWGRYTENVSVDGSGYLNLALRQFNGTWYGAEVISNDSVLGYGKYSFEYEVDASILPQNVVFGMFTYDLVNSTAGNREIDLEVTKFDTAIETSQMFYSVQPTASNEERLSDHTLPASAYYVGEFTWEAGQVYFRTLDDSGNVLGEHLVTSGVETSAAEKVHINLWTIGGAAPTGGGEVLVKVRSFTFTPSVTHAKVKAAAAYTGFDAARGWALKPGVTSGALIGEWFVDESSGPTVIDSSGNVRNGTIVGSASRVTGKYGKAIRETGNGQGFTVPGAGLSPTSVTLMGWFKTDTDVPGIMGAGITNNASYDAYALFPNWVGGGVDTAARFDAASDTYWIRPATASPTDGLPHHLAFTYDETTGVGRMYVDAVQVGTITASPIGPIDYDIFFAPGGGGTRTFRVGHDKYGDSVLGWQDEIRVFNTALSASEIALWMNAPTGASIASSSLRLNCTPQYSVAYSGSTYDLSSSSVSADMVQIPAVGNGSIETLFEARYDANNYALMFVSGGSFVGRLRQGGVNTNTSLGTYNSTNHRWWQITNSGSNILFQGSPDGLTWTTLATVATTLTTAQMQTMRVRFECGYYGTETSPAPLLVGSINQPPATPITGTETAAISVTEAKTIAVSLSGSDTAAISVTDVSDARNIAAGTETGTISVTESTTTVVIISATDTAAISATEARTTTATTTASDTAAISATEATTTTASLTGSETPAISVTESNTSFNTIPASDTAAISVAETSVVFINYPGADSIAISAIESSNVVVSGTVTVSASDSVALSVAEGVTTQAGITGTETAAVSVVESTAFGTVAVTGTESITVSASEVSNLLVIISSSDTGAISTTETAVVAVSISGTESADISLSGEVAGRLIRIAVTDSIAISATETANNSTVSLVGTDTAAVSVSESATVAVAVTSTESIAVSVGESVATAVAVTGSETPAISVVETTSGFRTIVASDTAAISVTESIGVFLTQSATDTGAISATENGSVSVSGGINTSASDSIAISVTESTVTTVGVSASETGAISVAESTNIVVSGTIDKTASDSAAVSVSESTVVAVTLFVTGSETAALSATENATFGTVVVTATETGAISATDTSATQVPRSGSETGSVSVAESVDIVAGGTIDKTASDTVAISATENRSITTVVTATDTAAISLTETAAFGTVAVTASDTADLSVDEQRVTFVTLTASDTVEISGVDQAYVWNSRPGSDSITLSAGEVADIFVTGVVSKTANDTVDLSLVEDATRSITTAGTEIAALSVVETAQIEISGLVTKASNELITVSTLEQISLDVRLSRTDSVVLHINDVGGLVALGANIVYVEVFDDGVWKTGIMRRREGSVWINAEYVRWTGTWS